MCRWFACSGSPVSLEDLLLKPESSLVDQSKHSHQLAEESPLIVPGPLGSLHGAWREADRRWSQRLTT